MFHKQFLSQTTCTARHETRLDILVFHIFCCDFAGYFVQPLTPLPDKKFMILVILFSSPILPAKFKNCNGIRHKQNRRPNEITWNSILIETNDETIWKSRSLIADFPLYIYLSILLEILFQIRNSISNSKFYFKFEILFYCLTTENVHFPQRVTRRYSVHFSVQRETEYSTHQMSVCLFCFAFSSGTLPRRRSQFCLIQVIQSG